MHDKWQTPLLSTHSLSAWTSCNGKIYVVCCRDIQNELVADVLLHILHVYQTSIEQHLTQPLALQYMFDLWYLNGLLLWKNSQKVKI